MGFPLFSEGVRNSIFFGVYGSLMRRLHPTSAPPTYGEIFMLGGTAGMVQSVIGCPVELVKIKLQAGGLSS